MNVFPCGTLLKCEETIRSSEWFFKSEKQFGRMGPGSSRMFFQGDTLALRKGLSVLPPEAVVSLSAENNPGASLA